jgi:hypothetical protein
MPGFVSAALIVSAARPAESAEVPEAGADAPQKPLVAVTRGIPLSTALAAARGFVDAALVRPALRRFTRCTRRGAARSRLSLAVS